MTYRELLHAADDRYPTTGAVLELLNELQMDEYVYRDVYGALFHTEPVTNRKDAYIEIAECCPASEVLDAYADGEKYLLEEILPVEEWDE